MSLTFIIRRVAGNSMLPVLSQGTVLIALRQARSHCGDIIIFTHHGLEKIKRVQAIEDERLYVLGDNPSESTDSRQFGWIDRSQVIGKVIWPRIKDKG